MLAVVFDCVLVSCVCGVCAYCVCAVCLLRSVVFVVVCALGRFLHFVVVFGVPVLCL